MVMKLSQHFTATNMEICTVIDFILQCLSCLEAIYVQLDMPLKPLWADYLRSLGLCEGAASGIHGMGQSASAVDEGCEGSRKAIPPMK